MNKWMTDWLTTCCEIWTKSIPLIILSISRTDPMLGGWIWIGGSPVLLLPWSKFKLLTTTLQGSSRNFNLQWVPKANFAFKTSRTQEGCFVGKIGWGNPWLSKIFDFPSSCTQFYGLLRWKCAIFLRKLQSVWLVI